MANTNAPYGARVLGTAGTPATFELLPFVIANADSTKIYSGDFVKKLATGYGAQWTATTAVSQLLGVFAHCEYLNTATGEWTRSKYWPGAGATGDAVGYVIPLITGAPYRLLMQTDATGAAFADIGRNYDIAVGTGSTVTGRSGSYVDISTNNTTATLPLRLERLYGGSIRAGGNGGVGDGSESGAYNWAIFVANIHGTTGI